MNDSKNENKYNHDAFDIVFFRKPIEEVSRWVGGFRLYHDRKYNRRFFASTGKEHELDVSRKIAPLRKMESPGVSTVVRLTDSARMMREFIFRNFNPVYRIYSVQGSETVTVLETETAYGEKWVFRYVLLARAMETEVLHFDYYQHGLDSFSADLEASFGKLGTDRRLIVHDEEERWKFYEDGEILSFEEPENYRKRKIRDRLNAPILKEYMGRNGLDYDNYRNRDFVRAIEYSAGYGGRSLKKYDAEANYIRTGNLE